MNEEELKVLIQPVIEGCTITGIEDYGDIFAIHFVNNLYYESKRIEDMEVGAGPIIYIKSTGEIIETGSGRSAELYVRAYRECGDVYGRPSENIKIQNIDKDIDKKKAILELKSVLGIGLRESKELVSLVSNKGTAIITLSSESDAEMAVNKLGNLGFKVKQILRPMR
ncbi:MAG: hypothetical protein OEM02_03705 [Desulfobulbaceae bacterium]|nr:hypothetical protein [Desulfobulbaceae bacterium]